MHTYHGPEAVLLQRPAIEADEEEVLEPGPPIKASTVAMIAVALVILPFVLYAGAAFFIPLFVSLFMSYALSPVVDWMERCRVPRVVGAAVTMLLVTAVAGLGVQQALNGTTEVLEELPQAVQKLRYEITSWERDGKGALKQVQKTADELQKLAGASTSPAASPAPSPAAPPAEPKAMVLAGTVSMMIFVGQLVSVLFLTYFLLAVGDLFRRRLMQVMEPSLATRKKALQILHQVHALSRRYFALVLTINLIAGLVTAIGLHFLDVRHPGFWGIAMAILHTIPYLGAAAVTAAVGLIAYLQFGNATHALAAAAVPLGAAMLIGVWLQTALMGRTARMNAVVVFVALLFFGMVWGGWGLLLAFPIMATVKIVFGEIDRLKPVALLMGD
jgi:predicted PurR-regulated permease PerM